MRRADPSIVRRLVLVTLGAGLVTGLLGAVFVQFVERSSLVDDAQSRNLAAAVRTAALVDGRIDAIADQLELIASRPGVAPDADSPEDELAVALRVSDDLDELVLHDSDGRPVAASGAASVIDLSDQPTRSPPTTATPTARVVADRDRSLVEITVPVQDPPGTTIGWLVGTTPLTLLSAELASDATRVGASAGIVAQDGSIVAHHEFDRVVDGDVIAVDELFDAGERTAVAEDDRESVLLAAAGLRSMPGWVVVEQPRADALAPVSDRAAARTFILLVVLASVVLVVVVTGRQLLRPLGPLADAVERVGRGERDVRTADVDARGEVGVLADGIDRMARSLQAREDELRDAEAVVRRSEERLRLVVEGVEDYAIILLAPDATIQTWNTGARRLLGYAPQEVLGRHLQDMFDEHDPPTDPLPEVAIRGRAQVEGWCRRADGRRFWAAIAVTHLEDDAGHHYGYAVILHDLTERRAARDAMEAALEREQHAANELRRANELKDEFLAIAAHEIRTPLSVILGASRLLGRDMGQLSEHEAAELREMLSTHADDLRGIVDRLLDFTRLQAGKVQLEPEPVDLRKEIDEHVRSLEHHLADHELILDVASVEVVVDRAALRHIVGNLLSNAAKFSPRGSQITVSTTYDDTQVALSVADEGVGVSVDDQERIFELFRQGARDVVTARGTGVGLAIVKRYIELLHGEIRVTSEPGEGSVFTVTIPTRRLTP